MALLVLSMGLAALVGACPFGGRPGEALPEGHPGASERRLSSSDDPYPGWLTDDSATDSGTFGTIWPANKANLPDNKTDVFKQLYEVSKDLGELCYWSFQTLPGPNQKQHGWFWIDDSEVDLFFSNLNGEASNFADVALKRFQKYIDGESPLMWAGCQYGTQLRGRICENNKSLSDTPGARLEDCELEAVKNQSTLLFVSSIIFKVSESTENTVWSWLQNWRTDKENGHGSHMETDLIWRGWGLNGQFISKVTQCSNIPEKLKYMNDNVCDQMGEERLLTSEMHEVWQGLCDLRQDNCEFKGDTYTAGAVESSLVSLASMLVVLASFL